MSTCVCLAHSAFQGDPDFGIVSGEHKRRRQFSKGWGGGEPESKKLWVQKKKSFLVFFAKRVETGIPFSTVGYIRNVVVSEVHWKRVAALNVRDVTCIFALSVTLQQVFFEHFAGKNQLPGLSISQTLVENGLIFLNLKLVASFQINERKVMWLISI